MRSNSSDRIEWFNVDEVDILGHFLQHFPSLQKAVQCKLKNTADSELREERTFTKMENPNALAAEETLRWKLQMEAELQSIEDDLKELDDDEKSLTPTPRTLMFLVKPNLNANARQRKIFEAEISTRRATIDSFACFIDALHRICFAPGAGWRQIAKLFT